MKIRMDGFWVTWGCYFYCINQRISYQKSSTTWRYFINIYREEKLVYRHLSKTCLILRDDLENFFFFFYFLPGLFWWSNKDVCLLVWKMVIFSRILLGIPRLGVTHLFSVPLYHKGSSKTREDILSFWCCFLLHTNLHFCSKLPFEFCISSVPVMSSVKYPVL